MPIVKPVSYVVERLRSEYFFLIQMNRLASGEDKRYFVNVNTSSSFMEEIQEQVPKNEDRYLGVLGFRFNFRHRNTSAEYCMFWSRIDIGPIIKKLDVSFAMISPSWKPLGLYPLLSPNERFFFKLSFLQGHNTIKTTDKPFEVYPLVEKELIYQVVVSFMLDVLKNKHGLRETYVDAEKLIKKANLHNRVTRLFSEVFSWKNLKYEDEVKISHLLRKHSNVLLNRKIPAIMFYPRPRGSSDEEGISIVLKNGKMVNLNYRKIRGETARNLTKILMRNFETMSKRELNDFISSFFVVEPSVVSTDFLRSEGDGRAF